MSHQISPEAWNRDLERLVREAPTLLAGRATQPEKGWILPFEFDIPGHGTGVHIFSDSSAVTCRL